MPLSAVIVDDNLSFLEASRRTLERGGITVAGVARTIAEAVRSVEELEPDLVLADVDLGEESGFELTRLLAAERSLKVILISTHGEEDFSDLVRASPAVGFLAKSELSAQAVEGLLRSHGALP